MMRLKKYIYALYELLQPIPVAVQHKAFVYGPSIAGVAVSNLDGSMDICPFSLCCFGRGLSDGLITLPEESY